jgi:uncharacterized RDD family membrane protein YckC
MTDPPTVPTTQRDLDPPPYKAPPGEDAGRAPDRLTRFLAYLVDAFVAGALTTVPLVGGLASVAYVLLRDGLDIEFMRGRSLGKRLLNLTVVRSDGAPMDAATSFRRNWPLAFTSLTALLVFIPVLGWLLIPFVVLIGLVLLVAEAVKVLVDPEGRSYGDLQAGTTVVTAPPGR